MSGGEAPLVSVVEATDLGHGDDITAIWPRHWAGLRRVLVEGKMGPRAMVVGEVRRKNPTEVALAKNDDVVETIAADRADQTFDEGILPGGSGCVSTSSAPRPATRWRNWAP